MFRLPAYQELSKEQDTINNLPLSGTHLVVGPPGTGKTVLAIYRAEMFRRADRETRFVVYNNTLRQYLREATGQVKIGSQTTTFHSWFCSWYSKALRCYPPPQSRPYCFDWTEIWNRLVKADKAVWANRLDHLVLDEAQDFPKEAFPVLTMIAENVTVFADEIQRITESNSTIEEIRKMLRLDSVNELSKNYRNSRPIAELAAEFYAGLRTGVADLPDRAGVKPRVMATGRSVKKEAEIVARYAAGRTGQDIGVLFPTTSQQQEFILEIENEIRRRNLKLDVQMYISGCDEHSTIDFSTAGIKIINYQSAKGLEFDAVFLPRVDEYGGDPRSDGTRMKFYMLTSRARDWLCIMHTDRQLPTLMKHVPEHLYDRVQPG